MFEKKLDIASADELHTLLIRTLNDSHLLNRVIKRARLHDNGFVKLTLRNREEGKKGWRIHNWSPLSFDSNIHSHRWDMGSIILDGSYEASDYVFDNQGEKFVQHEFLPVEATEYNMNVQVETSLKLHSKRIYKKWDYNECLRGEIHRISQVSKDGALTAMASWGNEDESAKVFSNKPLETRNQINFDVDTSMIIDSLEKATSSISGYIEQDIS